MNNGFDYDSFASDFPNLYPDEKLSVLFSGYDNPDDIIDKITSDYGIQYVAKTKFGCEQFEILEERKLKGQELNYLQQYSNENRKHSELLINEKKLPFMGKENFWGIF